ncbi:MAG TPA: tetratricopeptide repeat protein [Dehalococcoidia bacterium]|nr:tetratricopeptide repeat protein [Dehalococcoidia bacterium]
MKRYLGEGGRKKVYLAHDTLLDRDCALAVIRVDGLDSDGLQRVRREAQTMGRLGSHPNIVSVFNLGEEDGQPYLEMEYMESGDLVARIRSAPGGRLDIDSVLQIADDICNGLGYAHSRGIIHRDLKPANVWIGMDGRAKLGDFGVARNIEQTRLTQAGTMLGTVAYMPPEQALGREVDHRGDLYSLGALIYEMVTGRPPFAGDDTVQVIFSHIHDMPVAPTQLRPDIPQALEVVILRLLEKDPNRRFQDADEVRQALSAITDQRSAPRPAAPRAGTPDEAPQLTRPSTVTPTPTPDSRRTVPTVGREAEIELLQEAVDAALRGEGGVVALTGDAGIGKSRLATEASSYGSMRGFQHLLGRAHEGSGRPFGPWGEILSRYVSAAPDNALEDVAGGEGKELAKLAPQLRERLLISDDGESFEPDRSRMFEALYQFLGNVSQRAPLIAVLEDFQWADQSSVEMVERVASRLAGLPILLLVCYRDSEADIPPQTASALTQLAGERSMRTINLRPFARPAVEEYLNSAFGTVFERSFVDYLTSRSGGNPFILEEILNTFVEERMLIRRENKWTLRADYGDVQLPATVRAMVLRRIDRCGDEARELLNMAAAVGQEFSIDVLQELLDLSEDAFYDAVEELIRRRLIKAVATGIEERYGFVDPQLRHILYEELGSVRRRRLHLRIGESMERVFGRRASHRASELAYHFVQGRDRARGVTYSLEAGDAARAVYANHEATDYYQTAVQLLEESPEASDDALVDALVKLAGMHQVAGNFEEAVENWNRALALIPEERKLQAADIRRRIGTALLQQGQTERAWQQYNVAYQSLRGESESHELAAVYHDMAQLQMHKGENMQTVYWCEKATRTADKVGAVEIASQAYKTFGEIFARIGDTQRAREYLEKSLRIAKENDLPHAYRASASMGAYLLDNEARYREALSYFEEGMAMAEKVGDLPWQSRLRTLAASANFYLGLYPEAEQGASRGLDLDRRLKFEGHIANPTTLMGFITMSRGDLDDASRWFEEGLQYARRAGDHQQIFMARFGQAWTALQSNDHKKSYDALRTALEACERAGLVPWTVEVLALMGENAARQGNLEEANTHAEEVRRVAAQLSYPPGWARRDDLNGALAEAQGNLEEAEAEYKKAAQVWKQVERPQDEARSTLSRAQVLQKLDRRADALRLFDQALSAFRDIGAAREVQRSLSAKLGVTGEPGSPQIPVDSSVELLLPVTKKDQERVKLQSSPEGIVTIMFTDTVGSTRQRVLLGDDMAQEVLRTHNRIIREAARKHEGFEVKTIGDAFMFVFSSARKALEAAIDIQRGMDAHNQEHPDLPIIIRIGMNAGEVLREEDDFFGLPVVMATRIETKAGEQEIWVSEILRNFVGSVGSFRFEDRGRHKLKGLDGTHRLYAVQWKPEGVSEERELAATAE